MFSASRRGRCEREREGLELRAGGKAGRPPGEELQSALCLSWDRGVAHQGANIEKEQKRELRDYKRFYFHFT